MQNAPPLIVTVTLDSSSHEYFTALRKIYFPKHINYLEAHLTLFHHLPSDTTAISEVLDQQANRPSMDLEVTGVKNIGNGVAFTIASEELLMAHKTMQQAFGKYLISQDRQKIWPHITVQNKVTAFRAKQTSEILSRDFNPFTIKGTGLSTWLYLKGPWQQLYQYPFRSRAGAG